MTALSTFRTLVLSDATVATNVGTRMYANMMPPEAVTPAITYFAVAMKPHTDTCSDTYMMTRIQTNVYGPATSGNVVATVHAAMVELLHQYKGTVGSQEIVSIIMDFGMDLYEPETKLYRQIADWKVTTKGV
jgi:hypothetical protein